MTVASSAKLLRITAATINLLIRSIAVRGRVQRVIACHALEAATMVHLGREKDRGDGDIKHFELE